MNVYIWEIETEHKRVQVIAQNEEAAHQLVYAGLTAKKVPHTIAPGGILPKPNASFALTLGEYVEGVSTFNAKPIKHNEYQSGHEWNRDGHYPQRESSNRESNDEAP